jgi:hypothetical protein
MAPNSDKKYSDDYINHFWDECAQTPSIPASALESRGLGVTHTSPFDKAFLTGHEVNQNNNKTSFSPHRIHSLKGSWACPGCRRLKSDHYRTRLLHGINWWFRVREIASESLFSHLKFITLTIRHIKGEFTDTGASRMLPKAKNNLKNSLRLRACREGKSFEFAEATGQHQDGNEHIHLVTDMDITLDWLQDEWERNAEGSTQVMIEGDTSHFQSAEHIVNYWVKNLQYDYSISRRRINFSRIFRQHRDREKIHDAGGEASNFTVTVKSSARGTFHGKEVKKMLKIVAETDGNTVVITDDGNTSCTCSMLNYSHLETARLMLSDFMLNGPGR